LITCDCEVRAILTKVAEFAVKLVIGRASVVIAADEHVSIVEVDGIIGQS
jgi:hypothetical protein